MCDIYVCICYIQYMKFHVHVCEEGMYMYMCAFCLPLPIIIYSNQSFYRPVPDFGVGVADWEVYTMYIGQ